MGTYGKHLLTPYYTWYGTITTQNSIYHFGIRKLNILFHLKIILCIFFRMETFCLIRQLNSHVHVCAHAHETTDLYAEQHFLLLSSAIYIQFYGLFYYGIEKNNLYINLPLFFWSYFINNCVVLKLISKDRYEYGKKQKQ